MGEKIHGFDPTGRDGHRWYRGELVMYSCELTASVTALANALASNLTQDELNLLSAVLVQLADTLATISVQREISNSK